MRTNLNLGYARGRGKPSITRELLMMPADVELQGYRTIRLASGKRVLCAAEPLSGACLLRTSESALLIVLLLEGRLGFQMERGHRFSLEAGQFGIYRSQGPFGEWRLQADGARFLIAEGKPHVASVCPVGTGVRDVPACLCCPNFHQPSKTLVGPLPEVLLPEINELTRLQPKSFGEYLQMEARLLHVIGHLLTDTPEPAASARNTECPLWLTSEDRHRLDEVAEYLREHSEEELSLARLSQQFFLNEFKLKSGFKQVFGETVFRYLRRIRMERAKRLIEAGELSVTEVALQVGYSNPSQFSAAFSTHWGLKPKQYQLCLRLRAQASPASVTKD